MRLRWLDIDSECRPITYLGQDFTTGDLTAIAAGWVGEERVSCWWLPRYTAKQMLQGFVALWDQADVVTGHNLRSHDLPIINGALIEAGLEPLSPKLTCDTLRDITRTRYISKSQENLSDMLGVKSDKTPMNQMDWRRANRLTPKGTARTQQRVVGDVRQHMELREALVRRGLLRAPRMWRPR